MSSIPDERTPEFEGVPRVLARTVHLLRCFTYADDTLSVRELVQRSGLPRSTVHRITGDLVHLGLLTRTASGRYAMGTLVWELGQFSHISVRLRLAAQDHLTRLYEACGENVFIAVMTTTIPETAQVMFVGHVRGPRSVPVLAHEGGRFPLHTTASGRALVSAQSPDWIERYLARIFDGETKRSTVGQARLRATIAAARSRGYATQLGEVDAGAAGISAPIPSGLDTPTAVVTIAASSEHWDERRYASMLRVTAHAIAKDMHEGL